ncbi:MAG TPA: heparinase II/III family protein, partial [Thermomicrobiales bacterium]|nr:heparinase II/III family protein [Thermomicrobiales bacterium]
MRASTAQAGGELAAYRRAALPAGPQPWRPYILSPEDAAWLIEDAWPSLYFGAERVAEIRRKVDALPWAREAFALMREEAEQALAVPPLVPSEPCGWRHDFYARRTAAHLLYEPNRNDAYLDPTTGAREELPAQRRAWALLTHERTFRLMRSLGVLYGVAGDERYAAWVAEGMRRVAAYFTHHEFHNPKDGALYFQPLYDAGILLLLANAYDLTRASAAYTAADHARIIHDIFEDRVPALLAFLASDQRSTRAPNMACFAAAAVAASGRACDRADWRDQGLAAGLPLQLPRCLPGLGADPDGLWIEGSIFYHFYSLCTLIALYEEEVLAGSEPAAALREGVAAMLAAPVALADQELRLPVLGDLGAPRAWSLAAYRHCYEWAAGRLDRERFVPVLAALYAGSGARRADLSALAYGPDKLPAPGGVPDRPTVLPVAQIGVFRATAPVPTWLLFRAGFREFGHDHPDRLSVFLHAAGRLISPDLGTPGYALRPDHGHYYRSTLAHNTLFADEADLQGLATLDWRPAATPPQARGTLTHDGVTYRRTVFFDAPFIVLLDEYDAEAERRFGWVYHAYGYLAVATPALASPATPELGLPPLPEDGPWRMLTARRSGEAAGRVAATWLVDGRPSLRLWTVSDAPFEVTAAIAPGQPYPDTQGTLLYRAPGRARRFATVL